VVPAEGLSGSKWVQYWGATLGQHSVHCLGEPWVQCWERRTRPHLGESARSALGGTRRAAGPHCWENTWANTRILGERLGRNTRRGTGTNLGLALGDTCCNTQCSGELLGLGSVSTGRRPLGVALGDALSLRGRAGYFTRSFLAKSATSSG
jgi:hypothetical protein